MFIPYQWPDCSIRVTVLSSWVYWFDMHFMKKCYSVVILPIVSPTCLIREQLYKTIYPNRGVASLITIANSTLQHFNLNWQFEFKLPRLWLWLEPWCGYSTVSNINCMHVVSRSQYLSNCTVTWVNVFLDFKTSIKLCKSLLQLSISEAYTKTFSL